MAKTSFASPRESCIQAVLKSARNNRGVDWVICDDTLDFLESFNSESNDLRVAIWRDSYSGLILSREPLCGYVHLNECLDGFLQSKIKADLFIIEARTGEAGSWDFADSDKCWLLIRKINEGHHAENCDADLPSIVVLTPEECPSPLKDIISRQTWPRPDDSIIETILHDLINKLGGNRGAISMHDAVQSAHGLTLLQIKGVLRCLNGDSISAETAMKKFTELCVDKKKDMLRTSRVLDLVVASDAGINEKVYGMNAVEHFVKEHVARNVKDKLVPDRMLLTGIPGCGKSMVAKACSNWLGLPLVQMHMSSIKDRYQGSSERNLKSALRDAESISPCVLWIDEFEKLFTSEDHDSVAKSLTGMLLTWMQEQKSPVFIVATANDISRLPVELIRRFSPNTYGVGFPKESTIMSMLRGVLPDSVQKKYDKQLERWAEVLSAKRYALSDVSIVVRKINEEEGLFDFDTIMREVTPVSQLNGDLTKKIESQLKANGWLDASKEKLSKPIIFECHTGGDIVMLPVLPLKYTMGRGDDKRYYADEEPVDVEITKPFWLSKTLITQGQWQVFSRDNEGPSHYQMDEEGLLPVESVTWGAAIDFCKRITALAKRKNKLPDGYEYTLPTEAQWECACRAGTSSEIYADSLNDIAWYSDNSEGNPQPVAKKSPNAWGFYDMLGNVNEWCRDHYVKNRAGGKDPIEHSDDSKRVLRGGSCSTGPKQCRCAYRLAYEENACHRFVGFRIALTPLSKG